MTRADTEAHLAALEHPLAPALAELCGILRTVDPRVGEEIKWNSPSFFLTDHFATTNLRPKGPLLLVLHAGVKKREIALKDRVADPASLLVWKSADRAVIEFADLASVQRREDALRSIIREWIAAVEAEPAA